LQPPGLLFADGIAGYSECKANPLTGLSVECRCFFRMSIESSGEIAGFSNSGSKVAVVCNLARTREPHEFSVNTLFVGQER
jgi:hypothetical protein